MHFKRKKPRHSTTCRLCKPHKAPNAKNKKTLTEKKNDDILKEFYETIPQEPEENKAKWFKS